MANVPRLCLGNSLSLTVGEGPIPLLLPAHHLVTHGVIMGMTGSGKTGLLTVLGGWCGMVMGTHYPSGPELDPLRCGFNTPAQCPPRASFCN
jgi:hypothetical protein